MPYAVSSRRKWAFRCGSLNRFHGWYFFPKTKGTIIILNGPAGIGKSKIQKELQDILPEAYLNLGIKKLFFEAIPEKYLNQKKDLIEGTLILKERPLYKLNFKKQSNKIISGMHKSIAAYAKEGNNVIVDYIKYTIKDREASA